MRKIVLFFSLCLVPSLFANAFFQKESVPGQVIYVSKSGNDHADGSLQHPLLTIGKAVIKAGPGNRIIVRKGVYRESVMLSRGGTSDSQRINIAAAPGEIVKIKGSERLKTWAREKGDVWKLVMDSSLFKGGIFFNNVKMQRKEELKQVNVSVLTWMGESAGEKLVIKANFGKSNPNEALTEVLVRTSGISALANVNYITINGIQVSQVFSPEASIYGKQAAAIETGGGTHWVIQNCSVHDCSGVGISIGNTGRAYPEASPRNPEFSNYKEIADVGHHIIRNNHIFKCDQAGILGLAGGTSSLIEGNLVEEINTNGMYSGQESGGIRLALAIDAVIKGNLIRHIKGVQGYGIYRGH